MTDLVRSSDLGLARVVGDWSEEKLHYIGRYIDIFTTAMKDRWPRRVYVDLFSGPGRCVIEGTDREFDGSPLLALQARYPFTHLYLNDLDSEATESLRGRIPVPTAQAVVLRSLDCNVAARDAVEELALDELGTLGLAVIDPSAFQIHFDALEFLTRRRRIDLIITVMTGYLRRFIGEATFAPVLDAFFGSPEWRGLVDVRRAGERLTFRALLDFYQTRLRELGYEHVDDHVRITNSNDQTLYHLVFASKHPRGAEFFREISRRKYTGQHQLL